MKVMLVVAFVSSVLMALEQPQVPASTASVQPLFLNDIAACAAFSINEKESLWVTAAHCTTQENVETYGIGAVGVAATVVKRDEVHDLALIKGSVATKALRLVDRAPSAGEATTIQGFPIGTNQLVLFHGAVASPWFIFPQEEVEVMVIDAQALPGVSGAPIFVKGKVIGVFLGLYKGKVGQMGWASTWQSLKAFTDGLWRN